MLRRGGHTLLLIQRNGLARADFEPQAGRSASLQRTPRSSEDHLAALIESAAAGEPLQRSVWILTDEIVSLSVELDARAVRGLSDDDLTAALAYELQKFTGIPTGDGVTAWRAASPGNSPSRSYLVTQMPRADLEQVEQLVRSLGGRLAGVLHPAGLPRSLSLEPVGPDGFRRSELWPEVHAVVTARDSVNVDVHIERTGQRRGARDELLDGGATESLHATGASGAGPAAPERARFRLDDDAVLLRWLSAWVVALIEGPAAVPVLRPPAVPLSRQARVLWSAGLALAIAALAVLDHRALVASRTRAGAQFAALRDPIDRGVRQRTELATLRQQLDELERTPVPEAPVGAQWSAELPARLMEVLASARPEGLVVRDFDLGWQRSSIRGEALDAQRIDAFAAPIADALAGTGYEVVGSSKRLTAEGLYDFDIDVLPQDGAPVTTADER